MARVAARISDSQPFIADSRCIVPLMAEVSGHVTI